MYRRRINPDFHLDHDGMAAEIARMQREPRSLARPAVVVAGWRSPVFTARSLAGRLETLVTGIPGSIGTASYALTGRFDRAVAMTVAQVRAHAARGGGDGIPVDLIAISMGGLVARRAAADGLLAITRIFTLATPHRGARLARFIRPDDAAALMRPGSARLAALNAMRSPSGPELVCYSQLRDWWVGTDATTLPGVGCLWAEPHYAMGMVLSHFTIHQNPLFVLDIARRLRGETPLGAATDLPA